MSRRNIAAYITVAILLLILALTSSASATPRHGINQTELTSLYDSMTHPIIDEERVSGIAGASITRGGQKILFTSGTIRFFAPVNGKTYGAVFAGKGYCVMSPATEIERLEFERQTGIPLEHGSHQYNFQRAVFWFADSFFEELIPFCHFEHQKLTRPERDAVARSLKYAADRSNENAIYRIIQEMFEDHPEPYLLAHFLQEADGNDIFLDVDVRRFEEVIIGHPFLGTMTGFNFWRDPLCRFHLPEEYVGLTEFDLTQEEKRRIDIVSDTITFALEEGSKMRCEAILHVKPMGEFPASIIFLLNPEYHLRSVKTAGGKSLSFLRDHEKRDWETLVFLPREDTLDVALDFTYDGEFMMLGRRFNFAPASAWYPTTEFLDRSNFHLTYSIPDDLTIVSAGTKLSERKADGKRLSRMQRRTRSI